ncbi:hypothetical protein SADUNF_Sadunf04G0056900 [Salix dunnii]|uniref:IPO4/5-like TPR repeats domain-containing protein n=1 Tax=Salix dunnii TaxID=1413687 RepID=A0A835K663_9ROSI|nr:hypothetical protein SADUNF_Sadunf04G0056900 [Salix dunnii]
MASTTSSSLPQDSATPPLMSLPSLLRAKLRSTRGNPSSAMNWSPPPISRLRPPSLGSKKSPLPPPQRQSFLNSTRDYLRSKAMEILESPDTLPLSCFIEELNFPETATDLMYTQNLLNYLKNNYLSSFCFCLISFYMTCGSEFENCKEYAFDILCLILTEDKEGPWKETSFLDKEIKSAILHFLNTESSIKILNKIRDFVAKIATKEVRLGNDWPELLEFVYESLDSVSEEKVKYAVSLLYKLIPHCAVEDLVISLDSFYDSLVDIFDSDDMSLEVQVEAALTSNRFLFYWTNRSNHDRYSVLMIEIAETISTLVEYKSDKDVQAVVKELTMLAKEKPWTLSSQFDYVVLSVLRILGEVELQDKTRILALEFVIVLAEERVQGQQMLLGSHRAIPTIFEKILLLLANLKDDSERGWAENDIQNLPSVRCLDRIVAVLGGGVFMKNFPRLFDINFCAEDWRSRHAAVLSLGIVAERCSNLKILIIISSQVQAYSALYEFTSNCTSSILNPYLKEIVTKLLKKLREEKQMIKGETLKVLSAIAYTSQDQFSEYYGAVMPYLKVIMMTANKELDHNLLANFVDCITMVWMAVGKEKIRDDTDMVVKMLISLQRSELEANDPMRCQLLQEALPKIAAIILDSLEECMKMSGPVLDEDQTDLFLKKIMNVLNSRSKVGDIDVIKQTLQEEEHQEEQKVYDKAVDCLATFIRIQKPPFSPFLGKLLPCIRLMWINGRGRFYVLPNAYTFHLPLPFREYVGSKTVAQVKIGINLSLGKHIMDILSDVDLLGPKMKNLHKIVTVYAEILWAGKKLANEETAWKHNLNDMTALLIKVVNEQTCEAVEMWTWVWLKAWICPSYCAEEDQGYTSAVLSIALQVRVGLSISGKIGEGICDEEPGSMNEQFVDFHMRHVTVVLTRWAINLQGKELWHLK